MTHRDDQSFQPEAPAGGATNSGDHESVDQDQERAPIDEPNGSDRSLQFVWPSKPLPSEQALREVLKQSASEGGPREPTAQGSHRHPAPEPQAISHQPQRSEFVPTPAPPSTWQRLLGIVQQIEHTVLQPEILTLAERARQANWMPDQPETWCERCGEPVGPHERSAAGCRACHDQKMPWQRFVRLGPLEGELRQWVHEIKFARGHRLARELGQLLGTQVALAMGSDGPASAGEPLRSCVVVPVPTTYRRRLGRGIDHAMQIALGVSTTLGVPCQRWLARAHGRPQRGLSRTDRLRNARGVFRARGALGEGTPAMVVLVDDVRTTGATLSGCVRELRKAMGDQIQFCVATLAVTKPERDR